MHSFTIRPDKVLSTRPISRMIYGNFLELGFGRQADGMWGQMFFNRSFEDVAPYSKWTLGWLGFKSADEYAPSADWWHSGYEEDEWFRYDSSGRSELTRCSFWGFHHGFTAANLSHDSDGPWGFGQDGLWLRKGMIYHFRGFMGHDYPGEGDDTRKVTVKIVAEDDESRLIDSAVFEVGHEFRECCATFKNPIYTGRAGLRVEARWKGQLLADGFELYPDDALKGWRMDVIEALKRVRPSMIRFPGGCFASFYDWRRGVGPRDDRLPLTSTYWGGLENNDVGTDEFLDLCEDLGCEPFISVNVLTGTPEMAADWVEYCNGSPDTAMGRVRAKYGHPEPRKVSYWELDNETYRRFDAIQYAYRAVEFAKAMKTADPSIKIALVGYWIYNRDLESMLEICGKYIDFVSDRDYAEQAMERDSAILAGYEERTGRRIGLCNTEWLPPSDVKTIVDPALNKAVETGRSKGEKHSLQYWQQRWGYALRAATILHSFWQYAERFEFANFNNLVNTWGQNVVEAGKSSAWLSCSGRIFEFFANSAAAWPVEVEPMREGKELYVAAAWSGDRRALVISLVNLLEDTSVELGLQTTRNAWEVSFTRGIAAKSLLTRNSEAEPYSIREVMPDADVVGDRLEVRLPAHSLCEVILRQPSESA
jgi:alpha-L-arabinofuranosidase